MPGATRAAYYGDKPVLADATQAAAVADQAALTAAAAAALTATAPAALTSAQLTGGESPTEAEHNALQADVAALRTVLAAVVVDLDVIRTPANASIVDATAARAKVNALLASLRASTLLDT